MDAVAAVVRSWLREQGKESFYRYEGLREDAGD